MTFNSEQLDHAAFNSLTAHIAVLDTQGNIVAVNDAWRRFARENRASESLVEGVGLNYLDICQTATGPYSEGALECLSGLLGILDGSLYELELEYPCPSPTEERWFLLRAVPLLCKEKGLVISHINITAHKKIQEALRESREQVQRMQLYLKSIVDSMPSILVGVDLAGHVTEWNQEAERATGITAADARGRHFVELLPKLEPLADKINKSIRQRETVCAERLVTEKNDELHYSNVVIYPLWVANETIGAVIRVDDISNRIRMEQRLVQTEKMLSIGGLAAGMAHELNNPLGTILQGSQNIRRRLSPDLPANQRAATALNVELEQVRGYLRQRKILNFLEGISEAAGRAARIVADMLAFSNHRHGDLARVRVPEMLETAVRLADSDYDLKKQYDFRQVEIVRDYDPKLDAVSCHRTAIEQVFLNIIKNAAQAMADARTPSPHRITLRTRRKGNWAHIEIEDNGPGLDKNACIRVFEPFFTTKPTGMGTGLGLSVSYFIVTEQHGGNISVSSALGKGACFNIRLPLRR